MLTRAQDKVPAVRIQAILTLSRLQDPGDEDDEVVGHLMWLIAHDSSKYVMHTNTNTTEHNTTQRNTNHKNKHTLIVNIIMLLLLFLLLHT